MASESADPPTGAQNGFVAAEIPPSLSVAVPPLPVFTTQGVSASVVILLYV